MMMMMMMRCTIASGRRSRQQASSQHQQLIPSLFFHNNARDTINIVGWKRITTKSGWNKIKATEITRTTTLMNNTPIIDFYQYRFRHDDQNSTVLSTTSLQHKDENKSDNSDVIEDITEGKKRLLARALQGDAIQAQSILHQLESLLLLTSGETSNNTVTTDNNDSLMECREAVLDVWISYQDFLVKEYNSLDNSSNCNNNVENERKILREKIFQAADYAHEALLKTTPFLSSRSIADIANNDISSGGSTRLKKRRDYDAGESIGNNISNEDNDDDHDDDDDDDVSHVSADLMLEKNLDDDELLLGSNKPPISSSTMKYHKITQEVMLHRCNSILTAWAHASRVNAPTNMRRGIPQRATFLLQRMEASVVQKSQQQLISSSNTYNIITPTTESYNRVLEAWAYSNEHLRGTMAEQIYQNMLKRKYAKANGFTYQWIIHAWCHSKQKKSAFHATGHLMKYLRKIERHREQIEPTAEIYHMVLKAWTMTEDRKAPIKAMGTLRIMAYAAAKSFCSVPVDETCYKYFLQASAKSSIVPEQGPLADFILNKLKDQQIVPDEQCYTAVIKTYKNAALNKLFNESREQNISRAVELLEELSVAHNRSTMRDIRPSTENFNDVLEALAASRRPVSSDIADTLLTVMESSIEEHHESVMSNIRPNADSYKFVLLVYSKSSRHDKVQLAKQVLGRMKNNLATALSDDESPEESVVGVYNAFVKVCASAKAESEGDGVDNDADVLHEALQSLEELNSVYGLAPNSETYATLLGVCKKHLGVGTERSQILEDIFRGCCEEGLVDERVLRALKQSTSAEQYDAMVVSKSQVVDGTRMVPEEWTINVGVGRVITAEGRRAIPLSVHGRYTITKAMKEYRMRRLRSKNNQRVLQGGRVKLDKKQLGRPIRIRLDKDKLSS